MMSFELIKINALNIKFINNTKLNSFLPSAKEIALPCFLCRLSLLQKIKTIDDLFFFISKLDDDGDVFEVPVGFQALAALLNIFFRDKEDLFLDCGFRIPTFTRNIPPF